MFGFANALLLALLAAMALFFWPVLRRKMTLRDCLAQERLLFGERFAAPRILWGQRAFLLGLALYEFEVVFCNSMARENWPWLQTALVPVLNWLFYLCFAAKILLGTRYTGRGLVCGVALYFIARWVYFNGQNIWFLGAAVAILAALDVAPRRIGRAVLAAGLPSLAVVEVLHFAGIIAPDATSERSGSYRLMFGYGHPNTFGGVVLGLTLAWVLLRCARLHWAEIAGVAAVGVFLLVGPQSRSAALCLLLLAVLLAAAKIAARRGPRPGSRLAAGLCAAAVPAVLAVSYILPLFVVKVGPWSNDIGPAWLRKLDELLTCRISMSWAAYRVYPVKIAGRMLEEWPVLDNIWVYLLYLTGPVMTVLIALLAARTLYGCARRGQWQLTACLLIALLYGYMETQVIHVTTDPVLLLLTNAVFARPLAQWRLDAPDEADQ